MSNTAIRKIAKIRGYRKLLYSPFFGLVIFVENENEFDKKKITHICDKRDIDLKII